MKKKTQKKKNSKKKKGHIVYFGGFMADTKTMESISPDRKRKKLTAKEKATVNRWKKQK